MKTRIICYALAAMLSLPAMPVQANPVPEEPKTESSTSTIGKGKKKKPKKMKTGKKKKAKNIYRPGARQN